MEEAIYKTPTKEQQRKSLQWLKEQFPQAAEAFPNLFDEKNVNPYFYFMGFDFDRMLEISESFPFDSQRAEYMQRLTTYFYNISNDIYNSAFKDASKHDHEEDLSAHVELRNEKRFFENPAKEARRFMDFCLNSLEAFGYEYYPKLVGEDEQEKLFSLEELDRLNSDDAIEERRLKVWPDYHRYIHEYITLVLLRGAVFVKTTTDMYKEHPEYALGSKDMMNAVIQLATTLPTSYISTHDKVSNKYFENAIRENMDNSVNIASKKHSPIEMFVTIEYDKDIQGKEILKSKNILPFDRLVHDSILTLYYYGIYWLDITQVWQVMRAAGSEKEAKITDEMRNNIRESITKLSKTFMTITAGGSFKDIKLKNIDSGHIISISEQNQMITAKKQGVIIKKDIYHITEAPLLYRHAKRAGQILTMPQALRNTTINKTKDSLILQDYLLRRIMCDFKSKTILIDTMLDAIRFNENNYSSKNYAALKKHRLISTAKAILDEWVKQKKIIRYVTHKKGQAEYSIDVICSLDIEDKSSGNRKLSRGKKQKNEDA